MRMLGLALGLLCLNACGGPVLGGQYAGEPVIRFAARLMGVSGDYHSGDRLHYEMHDLPDFGGGLGGGGVQPGSLPHDFLIPVFVAPTASVSVTNGVVTVAPAQLWFVEVKNDSESSSLGPVAASINHWVGFSAEAKRVLPFGPEGPPLDLPAGFSRILRTCSPGRLNQLTLLPLDEVIIVEAVTQIMPKTNTASVAESRR